MISINPATGEVIKEYQEHSASDVDTRLQQAENAFRNWSSKSFAERAKLMARAAANLREKKAEYAELITREMGKPIAQSGAEIEKCAWACDFFADNAARFLSTEVVQTDASYSAIQHEPLGAVLAVMPWNFPFWQVFRFAAPSLMAGNVGVLKHASNVPGCALAIERVFAESGFPEGVFTTLLVGNPAVAEIIKDKRIKAVTVTGSEGAGRAIAAEAGANIKKTVLELGGSDPFIVLKDVDVAHAAAGAVEGRTINSGQSCVASKRFIVNKSIAEEFTAGFVEKMKALKVGNPMDRDTNVGPIVREDLLHTLHGQVERSVSAGAKVACGGKRIAGPGFFYEPTILTDVKPGMAAFDEETFGPVAAVIVAENEDDAIRLANLSSFGLGASIWTKDTEKAKQLASRIESGCIFVNSIVKSDPRMPFGGVKNSGYGRELSQAGIREFVNIKMVWVV